METKMQEAISTFEKFGIEQFKKEKEHMENFRRNCFSEDMTSLWTDLQREYFPTNDALNVFAKFTFDTDGNATPDRLFAQGQDDDILDFNEPLVAIKVHTALSILTQRTPDVRWSGFANKYEERSQVLNALRTRDWADDQTRQQYVMFWFYFTLFGTTFWRRFYEKSEREVHLPSSIDLATDKVKYEKKTIVDYDQVTAEAISPLAVWIDPLTKPFNPRSMRKVKYDKVYDAGTFVRLFEGKVSMKTLEEILPTSQEGYEGDNLIKVEYYEDMDLDLFYCVANDKELYKEHLPWNHKQLSVMMATWMPRGDKNPYGLGPIEMMMEDKHALDKFKSMTLTQTQFSIYKSLFHSGSLQGSGGESGDIKIRPDRVYKTSNPKEIAFFDMPGPGADSWKAIESLRARADDASGINRPLGGEIVNTTAFQTDLAKDAALARLSVPINNVTSLLRRDAELTFELQKQFYSLPDVKELFDQEEILEAYSELEQAQANGETSSFSLFVDQTQDGDTKVYRGDFRKTQLNVEALPSGQSIQPLGKQEVILTPEVFDWKGEIFVIADSLLTITPTVDRQRKLELFNLLLPLFGQPPDLVAKAAKELVKLYGEDVKDYFPDTWLQFLKQAEQPIPSPQAPPSAENPQQPLGPQDQDGNLSFEQKRAPGVVTNISGQKDAISAQSESISP